MTAFGTQGRVSALPPVTAVLAQGATTTMDLFDPVFRATGDPRWYEHMMTELPSRRRLVRLQREHAAQQQVRTAARTPWPRRLTLRVGDGLVALGERLRTGHPSRPRVSP